MNTHWSLIYPNYGGKYEDGDVVSNGKHVGIITGYKTTTSASAKADPEGKIEQNNWPFRDQDYPKLKAAWRYT